MDPVFSRKQCQAFDQFAIQQGGLPGVVLMENAGRRATDLLLEHFPSPRCVVVVVGPGNNGGDGYVLARHLMLRGVLAIVASVVPAGKRSADAEIHSNAWHRCGGATEFVTAGAQLEELLSGATLVVDAMFGTGLSRALQGLFLDAVEVMNDASVPILALDLPSGLDADTGQALGPVAVEAAVTVTFAFAKPGLFSSEGNRLCGALEVADIGVPPKLWMLAGLQPVAERLSPVALGALIHRREAPLHKGQAGRVAVLAGSPGKYGAGWLTARAALRGGAGVVTLHGIGLGASSPLPEVMHGPLPSLDELPALLETSVAPATVVAVGPGLGFSDIAKACLHWGLEKQERPVVLDADALTLLAGSIDRLREARCPVVLTPHPAEAARLLGVRTSEVEQDRFGAARSLSEQAQATVLLKGVCTLVAAPGRTLVINSSGAPSLATAGSGDVLTGLLASLLCFLPTFEAATCAAWVHGRAGESWQALPEFAGGMLAHEIADRLPVTLAEVVREYEP